MIAYSYLEKLAILDGGVQQEVDKFSFTITDKEVLDQFYGIITGAICETIVKAIKEHGLIYIKHLTIDHLSMPVYTSLLKTVAEPKFVKPKTRAFFVLKCKKFSKNNPYNDGDMIISNLCVVEDSPESMANFTLKVLNLIFSGKPIENDIKTFEKIENVVKAYSSCNVWPINFLLMVNALYKYKKTIFMCLYVSVPGFSEVTVVNCIYKGNNTEECRNKIKADWLNIVGLRNS